MSVLLSAGTAMVAARKFLLILAFVVMPAQASSVTTASYKTEARSDITVSNEAIVREAFESWASGRGSVFDLLSPDILWTIHGSGPIARTYNGIEDFMHNASLPLVSRLASPLKPELHHIWAEGDRVVIRFDASATTTSGALYRNQFVWIFRMEGGSVVEAEAFLDLVAYQHVVDNNPRLK
ncbi:MAG: nuclear transport factor 2 family protein [Asticcacaulis sp.]